jgi:hypothetical protein
MVSIVAATVRDGTAVEVTVWVGTRVQVAEGTGVDVSEGTGVAVALTGGAPGMTPLMTTITATSTAMAPVVTVTRMETITVSSLTDIVFHLPYLRPEVFHPLIGPNQFSN